MVFCLVSFCSLLCFFSSVFSLLFLSPFIISLPFFPAYMHFLQKKKPYFDLSNSVYLFFSFSLNLSYPIFVLNNNQLLRDIQVTVIVIFCSVKFRKYFSGNKTRYDDLPSRIPLIDGLFFSLSYLREAAKKFFFSDMATERG